MIALNASAATNAGAARGVAANNHGKNMASDVCTDIVALQPGADPGSKSSEADPREHPLGSEPRPG
jgi:hypothetical protein